ncbi:hypothetical protein ARMGADRAFT_608956 [Armillaria gallica]|uniref:Uncharacterized protein n=1 Tax=Armillaria gallica TaxID=47427 RepID=A0A2H3CN24_ARMGA|nr:hypothetical protein ARMGADRAFT_608956 [Armillaria gallica]
MTWSCTTNAFFHSWVFTPKNILFPVELALYINGDRPHPRVNIAHHTTANCLTGASYFFGTYLRQLLRKILIVALATFLNHFAVSVQWPFPSKYYQRNLLPVMLRCEPKTAPPPLTISSMIMAPSTNDWHHCGKCWRCWQRYDPYLLLYCSRILQLFSVVSMTNHNRGR